MRKKIVGIIQARIGSTRLPRKMLLPLHGKPIIYWVIERVLRSSLLDEIVLALPNTKEDNLLEQKCKPFGIRTFRGSENDVLDRFYRTARETNATHIVRICADNPLIAPEEIDNLIRFYENNVCDYAYNHIPRENLYPDGLGAEIVSIEVLENLFKTATLPQHREHCLSYITDNPEKFVIRTFDPSEKQLQHPELKFDIDNAEDYSYLSKYSFTSDITAKNLVRLFAKEE